MFNFITVLTNKLWYSRVNRKKFQVTSVESENSEGDQSQEFEWTRRNLEDSLSSDESGLSYSPLDDMYLELHSEKTLNPADVMTQDQRRSTDIAKNKDLLALVVNYYKEMEERFLKFYSVIEKLQDILKFLVNLIFLEDSRQIPETPAILSQNMPQQSPALDLANVKNVVSDSLDRSRNEKVDVVDITAKDPDQPFLHKPAPLKARMVPPWAVHEIPIDEIQAIALERRVKLGFQDFVAQGGPALVQRRSPEKEIDLVPKKKYPPPQDNELQALFQRFLWDE